MAWMLLALAMLIGVQPVAVSAKVSKVPRIIFTDETDAQIDARDVKLFYQVRVFGETRPKRTQLKELAGKRGKGKLAVDLENIRMFTVKEASYRSVIMDMRLRDGQELEYEVEFGRGDIVFEGKTPVGTYTISIKHLKAAVFEYEGLQTP